MSTYQLILGEALDVVRTLPTGTIDAVISDPPYPEIDRAYGTYTEKQWHAMMHALVPEVRRVLKPTGSAVFVLQPNSRKVGSMRGWLFEFQAWCCRRWNMVQDAWCWNITAPPTVHANRRFGLMRQSVKACVWLGEPDCYRNQESVLWTQYNANQAQARSKRALRYKPSGHHFQNWRCEDTADERGGSTPFNLLPIPIIATNSAGAHGHGAGTPETLCSWWVRYICPPGGTVLDPFSGVATVGVAALKQEKSYIGIEKEPQYHASAQQRLAAEVSNGTCPTPLNTPAPS